MDVTPREKFGIGSSLKKFVRKVIPNEIADIAVKAAPFVAPFNPAAAAAMAGIGGFDQTGSIGGSLKSAALTYGGGQLSRYAGGAGFQGNPFEAGGAFRGGLEGFKGGFSSPIGTKTGFGKMFRGDGVKEVSGINENIKPTNLNDYAGTTTNITPTNLNDYAGTTTNITPTNLNDYASTTTGITADAPAVTSQLTKDTVVRSDPGIFDLVKQGDYGEALVEGAKKFGKAVFMDGDKLDKTALLAAGSFGLTYLDAKRLANEAGEDITVEEYDEAAKAEFKEKYDGYLQNFFGGKAEGGRIGYANGSDYYANMYSKYAQDMINDGNTPMSIEDFIAIIKEQEKTSKAQGGRIGFKFGDKAEDSEGIMSMQKDEEDENIKMAGITFSRAERAYLFKRLGSSSTPGKSKSMPNLYYILNDPGSYPADAKMLKEIAIMGMGKKEGGRIGFESGANKEIAIKNAMAELKTKFPELSDENLFNLVMNGFGGTSKEKELPTPNITLEEAEKRNPAMFVDTTTSNPIPENAPNMAAAEIAKVILGTSGDDEDMTSRKFIFEEYVMPKRNDLMENFGLNLKEADDLIREEMNKYKKPKMAMGGEIPVRKNQGGVMELDYRENGGFVPVGIKEKADDVPAMLSKNEFVLTADAVRGVGNGSVDKGAEKLYNFMKQAETVGQA